MASRPKGRLWSLPNQLTVARIGLSVVFFVNLALATHGTFKGTGLQVSLNVSLVLFVLAVFTDFLDGHLARKWKQTSTFGRIADPFADKILICGGFVMLTGVAPRLVEPWFAVVIIFREFFVSGLRSFLESHGVPFGAGWSGKLKMVVQSVTIPVLLLYQANFANLAATDTGFFVTAAPYVRGVTVALLVGTLVLTLLSCAEYVRRARQLIRKESFQSTDDDL